MSEFYSNSQRALQQEFASTGLADRLEELIVRDSFDDQGKAFVEQARFFFLSSVNDAGFPTVSHKGGDPGFVKVPTANSLMFPCYDGNGMYYSMGNIDAHPQVGLLFIDFEQPHRIRIEGHAQLTRAPEVLQLWPETALAVEVTVTHMWINCPRYIQPMRYLQPAEHIPRPGVATPQPEWKSMEPLAEVVPPPAHPLQSPSSASNSNKE